MRHLLALAIAAAVLSAAPLRAQQSSDQAPPPKTDPKTDSKAAPATAAGKWNVTVDAPQGTVASLLEVKLEGKKVTGTISSDMGQSAIEGEFAEGKLTFSMMFDGGGGAVELWFSGVMKEDGTMTGTIDTGQGQIPWRAERVKDK